MYTRINYKSKKALKEAVAVGVKPAIFQPGLRSNEEIPYNGTFTLEGPHFPEAHSWYAQVIVKEGYVIKVVS